MKRIYIATALTCLVILAVFICIFKVCNFNGGKDHIKVGFIYDNDEGTPYTYNFSLAKDAVEKKYGNKVEIMTCSNVCDTISGSLALANSRQQEYKTHTYS